jgi:uncharacterized protein (TIGR02466 family)
MAVDEENMTNNKQIFPIFPTILASMEYDCSDEIRNHLNSVQMEHNVSEKNKEEHGLVSRNSFILNEPIMEPLRNVILEETKNICKTFLAYSVDEYVLTQSWVSHKLPNQYHKKHTHPNSVFSGVYYWDDSDHIPINFHKDNMSSSVNTIDLPIDKEYAKTQSFAWDTFTIKPVKNQLILFPSYLMHDVERNNSPYIRKSLAFNIMPKHSLGMVERLTYFMYRG